MFDPHKTDLAGLIQAVLVQVSDPETFPDDGSAGVHGPACKDCRCDTHDNASFSVKARRVTWLSSVMVFALVRKWIFGLALAQSPLSFLGMAAIAGTVPLIKEAVRDTAEKKKVTVKPFLAAGSVATILMGEAFSAVQILWIYNVAELTEDYVHSDPESHTQYIGSCSGQGLRDAGRHGS